MFIGASSKSQRAAIPNQILKTKQCGITGKFLQEKKPVFYQTWYDAGITKRSDILNQNQDFLKWHEFAIKFNLNVPFTTYYGLVNAIPKKWKANLRNPIPNVTHDTTVNNLKTSSIYSSLLNTVFVPPTAETKILRHGFTESTIPFRRFILCHFKSQMKLN